MPKRAICVRSVTAACVAWGAALLPGCGRDARLADHRLRDPKVGVVTAYGKTLDADAKPQEVVYVLLQAILDDYAAGNDPAKREAALDTQFAICAPDYIRQNTRVEDLSRREQLEQLYRVVHLWAPTLGFYRESFVGEYVDVVQRMHVEYPLQALSKSEIASVYINCNAPEPSAAGQDENVVALVRLVREGGFWRVGWVGFDNSVRNWRTRFPEVPSPTTHP